MTTEFQLVFNFEQTRTGAIFAEQGIIFANQSSRIALCNDSGFKMLLFIVLFCDSMNLFDIPMHFL